MAVDLEKYDVALTELRLSYERQRDRLDKYAKNLYVFGDGSVIEWTPQQKKKALAEAQADVTKLEKDILPRLKEALDL